MGRKSKVLKLDLSARSELEKGYRTGRGVFSRRCHIILLKSEGRSGEEIAQIVGTNIISVYRWINRYETEGLSGLITRPGRGRKSILNEQTDAEKVKAAVKKERQRLKNAKEDLEGELGKKFSLKTLHRFLKNLSADGSAYV